MNPEELIAEARAATERAVAPYSEYRVGAAVATPAGVYPGCNVEVANYSNSMHAETVAVANAIVDGVREFEALAVTADPPDGEAFATEVTPCGMCRQTLVEFCDPEFPVYCDRGEDYEEYALADLLPAAFTDAEL